MALKSSHHNKKMSIKRKLKETNISRCVSFKKQLMIVPQSVLFKVYSVTYINADGYSVNGLNYSQSMQKKDLNGQESMQNLLQLIGGVLFGLMSAQLNVEKVYGQYGHGLHHPNRSSVVISMKCVQEKCQTDVLGWFYT